MLFLFLGCETPDDDDHDRDPAYTEPPGTLEMTLRSTSTAGVLSDIAQWFDTSDSGATALSFGVSSASAPVATMTYTMSGDDLQVQGFVVDPAAPGAEPGLPTVTATATDPIVVPLDPTVGEPQTVAVSGEVVINGTSEALDVDMTYTLVDDAETVETAIGAVSGTRHYNGSAMLFEAPIEADVWLVSGTGIVRMDYTWQGAPELFGGSASMAGASWWTDDGGTRILGARGAVGPTNLTFRLDTYDVAGTYDADKDTHAQMVLLVRWADAERARTTEQPPLYLDFGTAIGSYSVELVQASEPMVEEEGDEGYVTWIAAVDQAARNESMNPISYHCAATWAGSGEGDVQIVGTLAYHVYE